MCKKKEYLTNTKYDDKVYIGKEFGFLKVIGIEEPNENKGVFWICECLRDGNIIKIEASSVVKGNNISCGCLNSTAEAYIENILKENDIQYKREITFDDLLSKKGYKLRFDFGIYKNDELFCLIEYDGAQHRSVEQSYGTTYKEKQDNFIKIQNNDKLKNEYAKKNNITLHRFYIRNIANNKDKVEDFLKSIHVI